MRICACENAREPQSVDAPVGVRGPKISNKALTGRVCEGQGDPEENQCGHYTPEECPERFLGLVLASTVWLVPAGCARSHGSRGRSAAGRRGAGR
jgi:hypothetical protein